MKLSTSLLLTGMLLTSNAYAKDNNLTRVSYKTQENISSIRDQLKVAMNHTFSDSRLYGVPGIQPEFLYEPYVHPGLVQYFSGDFKDFLDKNTQINDIMKNNNINGIKDGIFIIKKNNKYMLGYYKEGKLFLSTYVSPGKNDTTPKNIVYKIEYKQKYKRSLKYDNAPMPFSVSLGYKGIFLHGGYVDGTKRSHGCFRIPYFFAKIVYENISVGSYVIFVD